MGARKPSKVKILQGTERKDRINKREPKPKLGAPKCPRRLEGEARREWDRIVPELERIGIIAKLDRGALAAWCQAWADFCSALDTIKKEGRFVPTARGGSKKHPALLAMDEASNRMYKWSSRLGLSPVDRARMEVPEHFEGSSEEDRSDWILGKAG